MFKYLALLLFCFSALGTDVYIKVPPEGGGGGGAVDSVNGQTGVVVLTKSNIGLGNVNNTSDANKPVSTAQQTALDLKRDKFWSFNEDIIPNNGNGYTKNYESYYFRPLQNSPNESTAIHSTYVEYDPDDSGYSLVATGNAITMHNYNFAHTGTGNLGALSIFNTYINIGDGVNPIDINGYSIFFGFGNFNDGVVINGAVQGYGFQTNATSSVTMNSNINPFYDFSTWLGQVNSYQSYTANPTIGTISNNNNLVSYGANPSVTTFQGNAGYTGLALSGNFGTFGTGSYNGIQINPTVASVNYGQGLFIDMNNVTATTKYALVTNGDVQINGGLQFSGALSIGQLNAYASFSAVDGGGNPSSVHSLISSIEVSGAGIIANADTFGINTAALMTMQAGSSFSSGGLGIGLAALGLPAVLETHTGSTGDYVGGALFAISLSGTSTGGHVDNMYGGRWLAIPNGITTVDRHYNGWFQMPFGTIATDNWGIYQKDSEKNYFEGAVLIGDNDNTTNASIGLRLSSTTKAFMPSSMTTAERDALTAEAGMVIFNTSVSKHQGYDGSTWNNFY